MALLGNAQTLLCRICRRKLIQPFPLLRHSSTLLNQLPVTSSTTLLLPVTSQSNYDSNNYMHQQRPPTKRTRKPPGPGRVLFGKFYARRDAMATKLATTRDTYLTASSLVARTPEKVQPYLKLMRADKPIGTLLLFYPCAYSICLATPFGQLPSLYYLGKNSAAKISLDIQLQ